jgi:hypothetical protein
MWLNSILAAVIFIKLCMILMPEEHALSGIYVVNITDGLPLNISMKRSDTALQKTKLAGNPICPEKRNLLEAKQHKMSKTYLQTSHQCPSSSLPVSGLIAFSLWVKMV